MGVCLGIVCVQTKSKEKFTSSLSFREREGKRGRERGKRERNKYILVFMCIATSQRKPLQGIETQQRSTAETLAGAVLADGR